MLRRWLQTVMFHPVMSSLAVIMLFGPLDGCPLR